MAAATSPGRMSFSGLDLDNSPFRTTTINNVSQSPPSPRLNSPGPLPLPSFVFPSRAPSPTSSSPRSAPSSYSRASGRRHLSTIEIQSHPHERTRDGDRLSEFSFGGSPSMVSPSLASPRSIPQRPNNMHQRNVSEFIGRDGMMGAGAGLMPTSPAKSDGALPSPASAVGTPGGRRGHAHRRSAAISVSDLTLILKPNANVVRGGSAPTSPSAMQDGHPVASGSLDAALQTAKSMSDLADPEPSPKAFKNTRVGFSDEVLIIPRPLSMISSDSSSTARPGHSVSNSMSSIISAGTSPPPNEKRNMPSTYKIMDTRPRTAEPILNRDQVGIPRNTPTRRGSLPLLHDVTGGSTPPTPRTAKKWSFFGHENPSGESSPKSRPTSAASTAKEPKKVESVPSSPALANPDAPVQSTEPSSRRSSMSRKPSKNKKKVRSWAGSILSRKSRQRKPKLSRRSPTPPLRALTPADPAPSCDSVEAAPPPVVRPGVQTDFTNWKPRKLLPQEDSMSPIIDLDAALGPFNTPSSFGDDWDLSQQNTKRKRAMHSAAGLGGFTGPGMHYHRRAESAPEFENPRFGLHRLGSSSTMGMEDVFEEDEDEEWEDAKTSDKETSSKAGDADDDDENGLGIDIKVVDSDGMDSDNPMDFDDAAFQHGIERKGSGLSEGDRRHMSSTKSAHSATSLIDEPIEEEGSPVEIADDSFPPRPDSRAQSSDSAATPLFRPNPAKELAPVDIHPLSLQTPFLMSTSPYSASQSSFPSPRSPFSYDTQRVSSAQSSVTDEHAYHSLLMGEPGPELRISVDDIPSLTSSTSTMTKDNPGIHPQLRDGQRSASPSSAAVNRKRSSIASLSRLISSSHGEKSKLSIESRAPSISDTEKKEKNSKGKRISRLMQFWKPKEPDSSTS